MKRNIVVGFFDTISCSRRFQRERAASRMGGPPPMVVPEIFVENPDERMDGAAGTERRDATAGHSLSPSGGVLGRASSTSVYDPGRMSTDSLRRRDSRSNSPTRLDPSQHGSVHVGSSPRLGWEDGAYHGAYHGAGDGPGSEPGARAGGSHSHSRHGSSVSALDVLDSLDQSAWGESIRRSFTMRRQNS